MKFSIITASYNYEEYIKETIESVLSQTYSDWEMIVVDDGSKDNSVEVIKSYCEKDSRIKLYQHENGVNKGLVETVKLGVEKAENDWIVFLESDDTITPDYLETKLEVIKNHPEIKFIFNDVNMFGDEDRINRYGRHFEKVYSILSNKTYPANLLKYFQDKNIVATFSVVMLRKDILEDVDYDVAFKPLLDWYLWVQLAMNNDFYYVDKKLTNWRMHKDSYISVKPTPKEEYKLGRQFKKTLYSNENLFTKLYYSLRLLRRYVFRIHFKEQKICFFGRWYGLKKNKKNNSKVSVVIPVYNVKPEYIQEAIDSVLNQTYKNIEIIVVNDGSTNNETLEYLQTLDNEKIKLINQENKGLSMARNTGVTYSCGKYILPLDSDDKIASTYIEKAVNIIENNSKIGIVYCEAEFFGLKEGKWNLPKYNLPDILIGNCIFCTALFRKSDWEKVGGYKKEMIYGWEDYEFWLSLIELGVEVYCIPEVLFFYRQHVVSMVTQIDKEKQNYLWNQIHKFHEPLYKKYEKELSKITNNTFIENIFSIKNSKGKTHKIITLLGIKLKIKRKNYA